MLQNVSEPKLAKKLIFFSQQNNFWAATQKIMFTIFYANRFSNFNFNNNPCWIPLFVFIIYIYGSVHMNKKNNLWITNEMHSLFIKQSFSCFGSHRTFFSSDYLSADFAHLLRQWRFKNFNCISWVIKHNHKIPHNSCNLSLWMPWN